MSRIIDTPMLERQPQVQMHRLRGRKSTSRVVGLPFVTLVTFTPTIVELGLSDMHHQAA